MRNQYSNAQSIHDYLELYQRPWFLEFGCEDFGASIASLLELPISVYSNQAKDFFLAFIDEVLRRGSISFILRSSGHVDMAITSHWKMKEIAIPLWIINDTLIGFEIITEETHFEILNSIPLHWQTPVIQQTSNPLTRSKTDNIFILDTDVFCGDTIYLKIEGENIMITDLKPSNDLKFFERIASAVIPEIDDD